MNKTVGIATGVGIAIIIGVIAFQISETSYNRSTVDEYYEKGGEVSTVVYPENPQLLYGLKINKDKYLLGEKIFYSVGGIPMGLKDSVNFYTPENILYYYMPFDGDKKSNFKDYFRPQLLSRLDICEKEQLVGEWTVIFNGMPEEKLNFEVLAETLPHSERYYENCGEAIKLPIVDPSIGQ